MKTLIALLIAGTASQAVACSLCSGGGGSSTPNPPHEARLIVSGFTVAGALAVGTAGVFELRDGKLSRRWHVGSAVLGVVNVGMSVLFGLVAFEEPWDVRLALIVSHAVAGLFALAVPVIRLQTDAMTAAPTVVGGRDSAGGRWAGLGVRGSW